jgi:hypothetical protein
MKPSLEFEMPAEQDAFLDAIQGSRWKELVFGIERFLAAAEATEASSEKQAIYHAVLQLMRRERAVAGLTFYSAMALREYNEERQAHWLGMLNLHTKGPAGPSAAHVEDGAGISAQPENSAQ